MSNKIYIYGNQSSKIVETTDMYIRGHLLQWGKVAIQIRNISLITSSDIETKPFPTWAGIVAGIGVMTMFLAWYIGLILLAIAGFGIYSWYEDSRNPEGQAYLHIHLNSGDIFMILFKSKSFLKETMQVLADVIAKDGPDSRPEIHIDFVRRQIHAGSAEAEEVTTS